jgi:hypothetical protein
LPRLQETLDRQPGPVERLDAAKLTLGNDTVQARPGTWVHMPKGLRHSIQAKTPVVMLLLLLK